MRLYRGWSRLPAAGLGSLRDNLDPGRPAILVRERLVRVSVDCALLGVLVAKYRGADSPFFPLYLLAALGIAWIETRPRVAVATAVLVAGYPVAVVASGGLGDLASTPVGLNAGFMALFCLVVTFLASEIQGIRRLAVGLSSTLANEIDRVESDEGLISEGWPVMKVLSLEGILGWTVEAAHAVAGGPYAHVAALKGNHHSTLMEGGFDVCPSWWHPEIQRLVLQSTRGGDTVRSDEEIHGIGGFMAVPLGAHGDESWGAVIVGGGEYGAEEERALKLLAAEVAPALKDAGEGTWRVDSSRDYRTALPPPRSAAGALLRQVAYDPGDAPERTRDYAGITARAPVTPPAEGGQRLGDGRQRVFLYGDEEIRRVLSGSGGEGPAGGARAPATRLGGDRQPAPGRRRLGVRRDG